ncbi:rab GDP dissociation inhibitor alpha-like [Clavelina lepadiformis]|uniref:rab GDP dissociation inhibitor alpha-like n=1 Tax=Clavelina lepadiformis TaxID=159417 RepID=UPI00404359AF
MDTAEKYDVIILGTGFTECILGGILAKEGKKVLQLDRERFSGGANGCISCLEELEAAFQTKLNAKHKGFWNVDLVTKFFVGKDRMVSLLEYIGVKIDTEPLHDVFLTFSGSLIKVPISAQQVMACNFIPTSEKESFHQFLEFARNRRFSENKQRHLPSPDGVFELYKLGSSCKLMIDHVFTGGYKSSEAMLDQVRRFCDVPTPHRSTALHFPLFGLGELIQSLQKVIKSAGGRSMLNRPLDWVKKRDGLVYVSASGVTAGAPTIIAEPSYFPDMVKSTAKIARAFCVLNHPTPGATTSHSHYVVVPPATSEQRDDIYVSVVGSKHKVSPAGMYVAIVSAIVQSSNPDEALKPGLDLLGQITAKMTKVHDYCVPLEGDKKSRIFISKSYDATMTWETAMDDVTSLYEKITEKKFPT